MEDVTGGHDARLRAFISWRAISGWFRSAREARSVTNGRTDIRRRSPTRLHLGLHASRRARLVCSRVLRPTSTAGVQSEDTLLLPSESEAPMVRRPEGVSGSVAMAIRWDCHGVQPGISTLLPLFRDSLSPPPSLRPSGPPSSSFSLSLGHVRSLARALPPRSSLLHPLRLAVRVFLPRIHTYSLGHLPRPSARPFLTAVRPRRPFRLFCSQPDSLPTEATRWLAGWLVGGLAGWLVGWPLFFSVARLF